VPRPRLIERLNAGLPRQSGGFARKLTLVSAPAGFGKTTLVSEWVPALSGDSPTGATLGEATPPIATAWLSLDEGDNDLTGFLMYLIATLQTAEPRIGKKALNILQSPQPPPAETVLTSLINEIAAIPGQIILVLDDYHLIGAEPIHDALTFLVRRLPPQMHLVIATREDPPLPLARLRARGQLTEVRATDLRFSLPEAAEFLNQVMGLELSAADVAALEARTEGWIAGLQLAAISMQGRKDTTSFIRSFTGSHRFVLDYLVEEVLHQQPGDVQDFLLQTSILERMTAPLCDLIRDRDDSQAILQTLERANMFIIHLDEERRWYRYHELFADLLRQRLRQAQPEWVPTLHDRASEWYERHGFIDEAIDHALRVEDFERAATLIEDHVDAVWQRGEHTKLRRWIGRLPIELVFSRPHLCILHAWDLFTSGQQDAAERSLQAAEKALDASTQLATETAPIERAQLSGPERRKIQGRAAAIRAFLAFYRGDAERTHEYSRRALQYLPEEDLTWRSTAAVALGDAYSFVGDLAGAYRVRSAALEASKAAGNIYMVLIASMKLAVTLRQQGQLQRVIEICQRHMQLADESGLSQTVVVGWLLSIWGEALAELNDLDEAIDRARKGTELTGRGRDLAMLGWSYLCLVRILFSRQELPAAIETIQRMEDIARESYVPPWITDSMAAWKARIWLATGRLDAASQWVQERGLDADGDLTYLREMEYVGLARVLIAQGRLDGAATLLRRLLEAAETGGHTSRAIEILLLQALALQAGGDTAGAMTTLERALRLAEPRGFVRAFVDEGPPMARLLHEAAARGIAPEYARRLLAAFLVAQPEQADRPTTQAPEAEMVEPLSKRELEVLQLIAEGLTNREIAARLFLSLNTVKAHTRNIYGKLNVHSRTQAVVRSQQLGLLPRR
jgi:LuxR family maltose regulon positive regulatory protein